MTDQDVSNLLSTLQNISGSLWTIAQAHQPQPQFMNVQTQVTEWAQLENCRKRIIFVRETLDTLTGTIELLREFGRKDERHEQELVDITNELLQLRMQEKALMAVVVLQPEPVSNIDAGAILSGSPMRRW